MRSKDLGSGEIGIDKNAFHNNSIVKNKLIE